LKRLATLKKMAEEVACRADAAAKGDKMPKRSKLLDGTPPKRAPAPEADAPPPRRASRRVDGLDARRGV